MTFEQVIYNPTGSDSFPYQSFVGFYPQIPDNYNPQDYPIVAGIGIKIDVGSAYAMNLIKDEEYQLETTTAEIAYDNEILYTDKQYTWHMCESCIMWISFMQDFVVKYYAPDDLILQEAISRNNQKIHDHLKTCCNNDGFEYDVCSYGQCYDEVIVKYDFPGLDPEYKVQRQAITNQQIRNYMNYLERVKDIRFSSVTPEQHVKFSRQVINNMFLS